MYLNRNNKLCIARCYKQKEEKKPCMSNKDMLIS